MYQDIYIHCMDARQERQLSRHTTGTQECPQVLQEQSHRGVGKIEGPDSCDSVYGHSNRIRRPANNTYALVWTGNCKDKLDDGCQQCTNSCLKILDQKCPSPHMLAKTSGNTYNASKQETSRRSLPSWFEPDLLLKLKVQVALQQHGDGKAECSPSMNQKRQNVLQVWAETVCDGRQQAT